MLSAQGTPAVGSGHPFTLSTPHPVSVVHNSTVRIALSNGAVALVDPEDADLAAYAWTPSPRRNGRCYAVRNAGRTVYLHQAVWLNAHPGEPLPPRLDHRDGNGLDCRRHNLRAATHSQNAQNQARLGQVFKGITPIGRGWMARIRVDGAWIYLGKFTVPQDAARAYDAAARRYFGEFACVNFPREGERPARRTEVAA